MYLVLTPSPYTGDELLNYKSLDCYRNFLSGWVREVLVMPVAATSESDSDGHEKRVIFGKVNHSMRMSEKPLTPWVAAESNGKILCAHCDCKAGLGECCSHVASLLWAVEAGVRIRDSVTVTQKKAYWVMPHSVKDVPYSPVNKIEFLGKKRSLTSFQTLQYESGSSTSTSPCTTPRPSKSPAPELIEASLEDTEEFLASLATCSKSRPGILSLVEPYASQYVPKSLDDSLPLCLSELYRPEYNLKNYKEIMEVCAECDISVSQQQAKAVELSTKSQVRSRLWFSMRTGRITASRFKAASRTDPASPSVSLIMSVCHPELCRFKTAATCWGCAHEKVARDKYVSMTSVAHNNFKIEESGLFLSTDYPFIGASPDGLVSCDCCGDGVCEIKCPYCHKNDEISDAVGDKNFCLEERNGNFFLKQNHSYFYQVQCQLFCTQRDYCDFVVWTEEDIHYERIYPDESFWMENVSRIKQFFNTAILPELVGKFYSRGSESAGSTSTTPVESPSPLCDPTLDTSAEPSILTPSTSSTKKFCYCQGPDEGDLMLGCDNPGCKYEWFHLQCLKLASLPTSKQWYCPDCRKLPCFKRKRNKKL